MCKLNLILCLVVLMMMQLNASLGDQPSGKFCQGKRQSPIDIKTKHATPISFYPALQSYNFDLKPLTQNITSDNHSIVITAEYYKYDQAPAISGGPLHNKFYVFNSAHFHWDKSEHTLDGNPSDMELHVVFTKDGMSIPEAKKIPDGITVLGYFIKKSIVTYRNIFKYLASDIQELTTVNQAKDISYKFPLRKLAVPIHDKYYTYPGSLTTHDCDDVVTWIVRKDPLYIHPLHMYVFQKLYSQGLVGSKTNYRYVQPLNERTVYFVHY